LVPHGRVERSEERAVPVSIVSRVIFENERSMLRRAENKRVKRNETRISFVFCGIS